MPAPSRPCRRASAFVGGALLAAGLMLSAVPAQSPFEAGYQPLSAKILYRQYFPSSVQAAPKRYCDAVTRLLGAIDPVDPASQSDDICSLGNASVFMMARGADQRTRSVRLKLNSSVATLDADLAGFHDLVADLHADLGFIAPLAILAAVEAGQDAECTVGTLQYGFSRERGDIPRFNFTIGISDQFTLPATAFSPFRNPC